MVEGLVHHTIKHEHVFEERDVKRQKKLSYELSETVLKNHVIANSDCSLACKLSESSLVAQPKAVSDQHLPKGSVCAFCHTSKITEGTGLMLHYANGREVVGDVTSLSKAIPVHMKCIDWAPQVYYDGDTLRILEVELARAAKLKCSGCGLKGAALGFLMKSCRRSYHMPCAFEIQDCRWDCDHFVMMCPSHKSVKFPSEKSKSRKRASMEACPESAPMFSCSRSCLASSLPREPGLGQALTSTWGRIVLILHLLCSFVHRSGSSLRSAAAAIVGELAHSTETSGSLLASASPGSLLF